MSLILADRVQETTTTTGTGSVTLAGAVTGYQTFSAAVGNANTCYYVIADQAGVDWEVGLGTYASATNTLARTTVLASSNAGALVSFPAGTKTVWVDAPASIISFLATIAGNQNANIVLAGPSSGAAAQATFRALVAADLPAGTGTVTSVALSLPTIFTVTGSPVTTSGTLTATLATETANTVWAGPSSGAAAAPTFRALVAADLPAGTGTVTSVGLSLPGIFTVSGSPVTTSGTLTGTLATQSANLVWAGPSSGAAAAPTFRALVDLDLPSRSGSSLPGSPVAGQLYLWTPTGRSWLMLWDGSAWNALYADGVTTLFVDTASGTDDSSHGTGSGANAYKTIQFAVNQLPGLIGGNVTINVSAATYREQVTLRGKTLTGNFTITILGTAAADTLGDTVASSASNPTYDNTINTAGVLGFGTITKTGATFTVNAFRNLFIEITSGTGAGQIRVVHANTATVITITGRWDTVPDATSHFHVYGLGTRVTGADAGADTTPVRATVFSILGGQKGIVLKRMLVNYGGLGVDLNGGIFVNASSECNIVQCEFSNNSFWGSQYTGGSVGTVDTCVAQHQGIGDVRVDLSSGLTLLTRCRFTASSNRGIDGSFNGVIDNCQETYVGQVTVSAALVSFGGKISFGSYFEADASASDNISVGTTGIVLANGNACRSVNSSGGWGVKCSDEGYGVSMLPAGASTIFFYTGNLSGAITPTTANPGGNA